MTLSCLSVSPSLYTSEPSTLLLTHSVNICGIILAISTDSYFKYLTLDQLSVSDLADVQRKLYAVSTRWYNLGLELGLKAPTLDSIDAKHRGDPSLCFCDTLKE